MNIKKSAATPFIAALLFSPGVSFSEIIMESRSNGSVYTATSIDSNKDVMFGFFHLSQFDATSVCDKQWREDMAALSNGALITISERFSVNSLLKEAVLKGNPDLPADYHQFDNDVVAYEPYMHCADWELYPLWYPTGPDSLTGGLRFGSHPYHFRVDNLDGEETLFSMEYQAVSSDFGRGPVIEVALDYSLDPRNADETYELGVYYLDVHTQDWIFVESTPIPPLAWDQRRGLLNFRTSVPISGPVQVRVLSSGTKPHFSPVMGFPATSSLSVKHVKFWTETCVIDLFTGECKVF